MREGKKRKADEIDEARGEKQHGSAGAAVSRAADSIFTNSLLRLSCLGGSDATAQRVKDPCCGGPLDSLMPNAHVICHGMAP